MMKTNTSKQVKELTTTFPPSMLKPNTEADMIFSALADISAACQKYGEIVSMDLPGPSKCHIDGQGLELAIKIVQEMSTAVLHFNGRPCEEPVMSSEIELVSELTGTRTRGSIERTGQSQYKISYTSPPSRGDTSST